MFNGGIVTVFVTDMARSIRFYTEKLGLKLLQRYQDEFALVDAGHGLTIGLHPTSETTRVAPAKSGISIGLYLTGPIKEAVKMLQSRGVAFDGPATAEDKAGSYAYFTDPDGHSLYLAEMKSAYRNEAAGVR